MADRFRQAVEAKDLAALAAALHPEVVFHSPAVFAPYEGYAATLTLLRAVLEVFADFRYVAESTGPEESVLHFVARVGDRDVEGIDIVRTDGDGLVTELTVMVRPHSGLVSLMQAMQAKLAEQAASG